MEDKSTTDLDAVTNETFEARKITEIEVFPLSSSSKIQLSNRTIETLINQNPDALFRIVEENQKQQREAQEQEYRLEELRLQHAQDLAVKAEERKIILARSDKNLVRFAIVSFIALFAGVLWYSARVNDKNLPSTIFTAAMSAIAGGGVVLAKNNKDKENEKEINT
jgi:hypothetical protein